MELPVFLSIYAGTAIDCVGCGACIACVGTPTPDFEFFIFAAISLL